MRIKPKSLGIVRQEFRNGLLVFGTLVGGVLDGLGMCYCLFHVR